VLAINLNTHSVVVKGSRTTSFIEAVDSVRNKVQRDGIDEDLLVKCESCDDTYKRYDSGIYNKIHKSYHCRCLRKSGVRESAKEILLGHTKL
jgi:hypothetical protein